MYCVGLTGNIASGKSTAIRYFKSLGIPVINADEIAREITAPGEPALATIKEHFGQSIINEEGSLNRAALRKIIFSDPKERLWLENCLHPLIRQRIQLKISQSQGSYTVIEIPLLINTEDYPYLNRILVILSKQDNIVQRVMQRDQHSREEALAILETQPKERSRRAIADDILINDGSLDDFKEAIKQIHKQYLLFANKAR